MSFRAHAKLLLVAAGLFIAYLSTTSCSSTSTVVTTEDVESAPHFSSRELAASPTSGSCQSVPAKRFYQQFLDRYSQERLLCQKVAAKDNTKIVELRSFEARFAGRAVPEQFVVVVDPESLETSIVPSACVTECREFKPEEHADKMNYARALIATLSTAPEGEVAVTHEESKKDQIFLTADLCPSKNKYDSEFFKKIAASGGRPTPVALSVAGGWLRHHQNEFREIVKFEQDGKIKITWVNHSYSHPYVKDLPLDHNFLLSEGVDLNHEVFGNEKLMIFNGLMPSVFFRFPGLVTNAKEIEKLKKWGIVSVSADAWLAKGQKIKTGSIILVHANGNEPLGLSLLYKYLDEHSDFISKLAGLNFAFTKK